MKATRLLLAAALLTGLTALSFAGPGPDYWARINKAEKDRAAAEAKAKTDAPAKVKPAAEVTAACVSCGCSAKKV